MVCYGIFWSGQLLRNIQNIRICMGKNPIVSVTYENERISIKKNSVPYLKCVLRLSCVVQGSIYGRFMGFCVCYIERKQNGHKSTHGPHRRDNIFIYHFYVR